MSTPYELAIAELLADVADGKLTPRDAQDRLRDLPAGDLGFAKLDHHRVLRTGIPEVVYGEGKQPDQIAAIVDQFKGRGHPVLVTRLSPDVFALCRPSLEAGPGAAGDYDPVSRTWIWSETPVAPTGAGTVVVACAGTSDLPVAEEAARVAEALGNRVERVVDVGVAGIHRTLASLDVLRAARVIIVVAGMEGALPSVVAGLVACPVIAVPTSVGYGASFGGVAALLAMLNSCAPGVTVVNIDNGFGAACAASLINHGAALAAEGSSTP
jgi:NCAIR mutase (PurE)-related protein